VVLLGAQSAAHGRSRACSRSATACSASLVEFVRLPDAHIGYLAFGWLTMGQLLSLPLILLGAVLIWLAYRPSAGRA
jgi:prolipoprotein diacylglyceryltransferase